MPQRIHFIWWGPNQGDMSVATPNAFQDAYGGSAQIHFWCPAPGTSFSNGRVFGDREIRRALHPAIRLETIQSGHRGHGRDADWRMDDNTYNVFDKLREYRANSAVKDLLSLWILYKYGGLYIDTTCAIGNGWRTYFRSNIVGQINALTRPMVVGIGGGNTHQLYHWTPMAAAFGQDVGQGAPAGLNVPAIDVWALFSPGPLNPVFAYASQSYVGRARALDITKHTTQRSSRARDSSPMRDLRSVRPTNPEPNVEDNPDYWMRKQSNPPQANDKLWRNSIIAQLIIRAVYDGFLGNASGGQAGADQMGRDNVWGSYDEDNTRIVPGLGYLSKTHHGSWR